MFGQCILSVVPVVLPLVHFFGWSPFRTTRTIVNRNFFISSTFSICCSCDIHRQGTRKVVALDGSNCTATKEGDSEQPIQGPLAMETFSTSLTSPTTTSKETHLPQQEMFFLCTD